MKTITTKDWIDLINENKQLHTQLAKANERVAELEKELTLSTDQNDMVLDEFVRVKCLTDNTEIHQLCERAHLRMRQNVSVIDRNHKLERQVSELKKRCADLDSIADTAFKYNHSSAECLRAWNKLQQLRKEQENV